MIVVRYADDQIVGYFDMVAETLGADVPWVVG